MNVIRCITHAVELQRLVSGRRYCLPKPAFTISVNFIGMPFGLKWLIGINGYLLTRSYLPPVVCDLVVLLSTVLGYLFADCREYYSCYIPS